MICMDCGRSLNKKTDFFCYKDKTPYHICKKCVRESVYPNTPSTYMKYLRAFDVPYIEEVWKRILERKQRRGELNSVFGTYLNTMYLCGYRGYTFSDSYLFTQDKESEVNASTKNV